MISETASQILLLQQMQDSKTASISKAIEDKIYNAMLQANLAAMMASASPTPRQRAYYENWDQDSCSEEDLIQIIAKDNIGLYQPGGIIKR